MIIRKMYIRNFGKIRDCAVTLSPGINVLYGENESGKTTFHTFIKSMLYGLPRSRGRSARNDAYSSYEPWDNPSEYGGILYFHCGGEDYRLTRNFSRMNPGHELFEEKSGAIVDAENGSLAKVLGRVSEAVYDNTVSVGQLKSVTGQDLVRELQSYMAGYQGAADTTLNPARAVQMLKMNRKDYQRAARRQRERLETEEHKLQERAAVLKEEAESLEEKREAVRSTKKKMRFDEHGEEVLERWVHEAEKKARSYLLAFLFLVSACILGEVLTFSRGTVFRAVFAVPGLLFAAAGMYLSRRWLQEKRRREKKRTVWSRKSQKASGELQALNERGADLRRKAYNLRREQKQLQEEISRKTTDEEELDAINLALSAIEDLSTRITEQVGRSLRERTSQILSEITGGKYDEVLIDDAFRMSVVTEKRIIPLERLSRGTLEQIYFALRMAAGELLCGDEIFPVILDDVFGMYDEERLRGVLRWLHGEERQIIISTCSKREMELLRAEGIPFQRLTLE